MSCTLFYGQGTSYNLGFSQVLNLSFSGNYTTVSNDYKRWINVGTLTVPSNKAHKITNGSSYLITNSFNQVEAKTFMRIGEHVFGNEDGNVGQMNSPIWLSSGTYNVYILFDNGSSSWENSTLKGALSIVEFNIE